MIIIGCDYHPGFQQIAFVDTDSGELNERKLGHREEAEQFYRQLKVRGKKVRVGMEASGHARWFERLLTELQFELWIGGCSRDPHQTGAQTENRPPGRRAATATPDGRPLSTNLGSGRGKSGSAATALASASAGADAHAHHESVARAGIERRSAA